MRRTVITGLGIISSIGNTIGEVRESLKNLSSGITVNETNKTMGLRSQISGNIKNLDLKELIDGAESICLDLIAHEESDED